jgi:hypothetical protein
MMPTDHRSAAGSASSPLIRSGEMYSGTPGSCPVAVSTESPSISAMPKP